MSVAIRSEAERIWMRVAWSLFEAAFGTVATRGEVHAGVGGGGEAEPGEVPIEVWVHGVLVGLAFVRGPSGEETDLAWSEAVGAAARVASGLLEPVRTSTLLVPRLRARAPALSPWSACVSSSLGRVRFVVAEGVSPDGAREWPPTPGERVSVIVSCAGSPQHVVDGAPVVFALAGADVGVCTDEGASWATALDATGRVELRSARWMRSSSGFEATARIRAAGGLGVDEVGHFVGYGAYAGWGGELLVSRDGALGIRAMPQGDPDDSLTR